MPADSKSLHAFMQTKCLGVKKCDMVTIVTVCQNNQSPMLTCVQLYVMFSYVYCVLMDVEMYGSPILN